MKLASYHDGSRDGQLVVVSRDLETAHYATGIASRLQQALDDWNFISPQLQSLYDGLNAGRTRHAFAFEAARCAAPLPRAYQRLAGAAYASHLERLRRANDADATARDERDPLVCQAASDDLLGARDPIVCTDPDAGLDFAAELVVVTGDVAMGASPEQALDAVRLLMVANAPSLRDVPASERERGCGLAHGRLAAAFAPVAVTPDELGTAWRGGRAHLRLHVDRNGREVGRLETGSDMTFHFGQLIAHVATRRRLRAGTLVGSGAVSNADAANGFGCLAERRALELVDSGSPETPFLQTGDTVRIDARDGDGASVFGAIDQRVVAGP